MKKPFSPNLSVLRRRSSPLARHGFFYGALFLGLALVLVSLRLFLPDVLTALSSPFWELGTGASQSVHTTLDAFSSNTELVADRDRLMNDNAALMESNRVLEAKVADLEKLSGTHEMRSANIVAGVLARPPVSPYDMLLVGAGSKQGVTKDALVYGVGGTPLGTIESTSESSARVSLYSAPGRETSGWIGEAHTPLILTGIGGGAFIATISHSAGITAGAVVSLPGPGALPVGTVIRVDSNPSSPRDTLHIQPYQNIFTLTWVAIGPKL